MTIDELARLIRGAMSRSHPVEIDGLGTFSIDDAGEVFFSHHGRARVFISYAREDSAAAVRLFKALEKQGYAPWLDRRKLLPGQDWPRRIDDAIASSDFFIPCFSKRSVRKRGAFQAEIRLALDCARRMPLDEVFLIPVRLDDCRVPERIRQETQFVDLFPDWSAGFGRVVEIIEKQSACRLINEKP
ncbi:MAG TPA: toll/interleukin-1 receptor domain-containing protein [Bryobacteraceae bacterium]|nr:toll/interleukin-1 receptor domain-containing protein [Bryobacteraceae bacterium]